MTFISSTKKKRARDLHHPRLLILTFTISVISAALSILPFLNISLTNYTSSFSCTFIVLRTFILALHIFQRNRPLYIFLLSIFPPFTNTILSSTVIYIQLCTTYSAIPRCTFAFISSCNIVVSCAILPYA